MLGEPGMVGRRLEGEVERDLEPEGTCGGDEPVEVVDRPQLAVHRGVAAVGRADGPRAAGILGPRPEAVVGSLAVRAADRVDRRQVHDVEAELGEPRQRRFDALQPAERAGKQLVPRPETGELRVDVDPVGARRRRVVLAPLDLELQRRVGGGDRLARDQLAFGQLDREVGLSCLLLATELVLPERERIGPRFDAEVPVTQLADHEGAFEPIGLVGHRAHRCAVPVLRVGRLEAHRRAHHLRAVGDDGGGHPHLVADAPLHRFVAAVDARPDILDPDRGRHGRRGLRFLRPGHDSR